MVLSFGRESTDLVIAPGETVPNQVRQNNYEILKVLVCVLFPAELNAYLSHVNYIHIKINDDFSE